MHNDDFIGYSQRLSNTTRELLKAREVSVIPPSRGVSVDRMLFPRNTLERKGLVNISSCMRLRDPRDEGGTNKAKHRYLYEHRNRHYFVYVGLP